MSFNSGSLEVVGQRQTRTRSFSANVTPKRRSIITNVAAARPSIVSTSASTPTTSTPVEPADTANEKKQPSIVAKPAARKNSSFFEPICPSLRGSKQNGFQFTQDDLTEYDVMMKRVEDGGDIIIMHFENLMEYQRRMKKRKQIGQRPSAFEDSSSSLEENIAKIHRATNQRLGLRISISAGEDALPPLSTSSDSMDGQRSPASPTSPATSQTVPTSPGKHARDSSISIPILPSRLSLRCGTNLKVATPRTLVLEDDLLIPCQNVKTMYDDAEDEESKTAAPASKYVSPLTSPTAMISMLLSPFNVFTFASENIEEE